MSEFAPVLLSSRGLSGERSPDRLTSGDLQECLNVDFSDEFAQREGGSAKINASAISGAPSIIAGHDWWPTSTTQRRVIALDTGAYRKDDMTGAYATVLRSGLSTGGIPFFAEGGLESAGRDRKLFAVDGRNVVQVLAADAATMVNLATPPADWSGANQPSCMFEFRGVMVGLGNLNFPYQLYASLGADHEDYTAGGTWTLAVYPGTYQRLIAGITAFGRAWLLGYPSRIFWVNDAASSVSGWYVQPATSDYGIAPSPHAIAQIDESVVAFVSNTGGIILMQESSGSLTGATFTDLTKLLDLRTLLRQNFNLGALDKIQMRWYQDRKQLHIAWPGIGSAVANRRLVIDFNRERTRVSVSDKDTTTALWMEQDAIRIPRPVSGDNAGFTWLLDQQNRDKDGAAYTYRLSTVPTDFSDVKAKYMGLKVLHYLHLEYESAGDFDVNIEVLVDGVSKGTVPFNMGPAGSTLPRALPFALSSDSIRRRIRAIVGEGHYVQLIVSETTGLTNPKLARAWVEFSVPATRR